ncbi:MAG: hypothetical protein EXS31_03695 [Pedosphaera sp.]|nr:hypothetical protein [Pedosphaera sp.]
MNTILQRIWALVIAAVLSGFIAVGASLSARAGTLAQFRTELGVIDVELFDQDKPVTVRNFIRYAQSGRYQNSILHRCPASPLTGLSDFVVQGGGVFVANRGKTNARPASIETFGDITNEFSTGRQFSNVYGTIAMAKRSGDTNSASSQWFFNLKDNSFLDTANSNNLFVVFGRVVGGTNVLNQFIGRSYGNGLVNAGGVLNELPVNFSGVRDVVKYGDLFYLDVSVLTVSVEAMANAGVGIGWQSVSNRLNVLEFTQAFPPRWEVLSQIKGTGTPQQVIDTSPNANERFYRVRVDY